MVLFFFINRITVFVEYLIGKGRRCKNRCFVKINNQIIAYVVTPPVIFCILCKFIFVGFNARMLCLLLRFVISKYLYNVLHIKVTIYWTIYNRAAFNASRAL